MSLRGSYAALLREDKTDPRNAKILVTRAHSIDPSHPWLQVARPDTFPAKDPVHRRPLGRSII